MLQMCHCAVYRIRDDIFCLTCYRLTATRWGSFPLLRKASLSLDKIPSTHTPPTFGMDLHSHTTNLYKYVGHFRLENHISSLKKAYTYIGEAYKPAFVKVFFIPHHHPHKQNTIWSVWGVIYWINECHTILHTDSHGRSFDAHFSALWSLCFFSSERRVDRRCVAQHHPELFVPVFIWGSSACLHQIFWVGNGW